MTSPDKLEPPKESPTRTRLRAWWEGVLEGDGGFAGKALTVLLVVALAAASAWVLVPLRIRPVVPYDDSSLGTFSEGVVKADRDYTIPDEETTQRKRDEARQQVRAVYDFDATAADATVKRVHDAFGLMQQALADYRLQADRDAVQSPVPADPAAAGDAGSKSADEAAAAPAREDPKAIAGVFQAKKAEFLQILQAVVDENEFNVLVKAQFDPAIENGIATLVSDAMRRPLVSDLQLLAADRERGIVLRPVPARDSRDERIVTDIDKEVYDVAAARGVVAEQVPAVMEGARPDVRAVVRAISRRLVKPNLTFNRDETLLRQDKAAESVKPSVIQVARGEKIIGDGERIERRHLLIFRGMREQTAGLDTAEVHLGAGLIGVLVALTLFAFARGAVWRFRPNRKDVLFLLVVLVSTLVAGRAGLFMADLMGDRLANVPEQALYYAVPMAASVMLIRLVLSGEYTLVYSAVLSLFAGVLTDGSLGFALYTFVGGLVAADRVGRARDRSGIWRAGVLMALANVLVVLAIQLKEGHLTGHTVLVGATAAIFAGAITPLLVLGLTYLVEKLFGYTTDLTLLELANLNNPLLKELVVSAPGTYHHAMMLGSMVDAAAEAIGANPVLARVGAYYHDIGKGKNPQYFAENQKGENPHDKLAPSMSALIIRRHVTDGIKMAKSAGIPQPIMDMIPMHHGTRLMSYFWHKAKENAERAGEPAPSELEYRHIGPKPRFREAALLMIADSVEAAARTLPDPNPDRFRGVVQKVINACFADGQFDECDITLKDLHAVTRSFVRSLEAIYHTRPEYQQPADKSDKAPAKAKEKDKPQTGTKIPAAGAAAAAPNGKGSGNGGGSGPGKTPAQAPEPAPSEPAPREEPAAGEAASGDAAPATETTPPPEGSPDAPADGEALKRLGTN